MLIPDPVREVTQKLHGKLFHSEDNRKPSFLGELSTQTPDTSEAHKRQWSATKRSKLVTVTGWGT